MIEKNLAYKERNLNDILFRKKQYQRLKEFIYKLRAKRNFSIETEKSNFILYPSISDIQILKSILQRIDFSLPKKEKSYITIALDNELLEISKNLNLRDDIKYISKESLNNELKNNIILIHDMNKIPLSVLRYAQHLEIIDNYYFSDIEAETIRKIFFYSFNKSEKDSFLTISKRNFIDFLEKNKHKKEAYCFTSGPSFDKYKDFDIDKNSLKVICNSIVKNNDFLNYIGGADIVTFADPVFHFGPSEYAEAFRKDVINFLNNYDAYAIIPDYNLPLILSHYPHLKNKLIGMPIENKDFNFPNKNNFYVKGSSNILTLFMIPIASTIVDKIFFIGADGRKKEEKYFWKHSSSAQYDDKMDSAFTTHPSFFRDRDYEDYYEEHCNYLKKLINYGESLDKIYASITESFIPVLQEHSYDLNKSKKENIDNLIELKNKNKNKFINANDNLDFSKKINNLYSHINKLKNSNYKLAIYGNGLIGKIFQQELKDQIVAIFDKNTDSSSNICNISDPNKIFDFDFDKLVISVLGREEEIIKDIQLPEDKIYTISINSKAKDIVFLDKSDKSDTKTIVGPFTKESNISFDETRLLSAYVGDQNNGIMIDVGAHNGSAARPFLEKSWNVYGYEPDPNNRKVLIEKLSIYNSFILSSCAVSDQAGEILDFYASEESAGISGLSSFTENHKKICQVTTTTLTDEINKLDIKNVDFLKIDTEGFDLMVLKGFPWEKMTPNIIECEFEDFKTVPLGYNFNDISNYLVSKGYTVYVSEWYPIIKYGSKHTWKRLFKYDNQKIDKSSWGNLLAFKETPNEASLIELLKEVGNIEY